MTRVLLVEDDLAVRRLCERVLANGGYRVRSVGSGTEALAQSDFIPDILVADFGLPDMTGYELAEALRSRHPRVSALIMSGHFMEHLHSRGLPIAHVYLEKPFPPAELLRAVTALAVRNRRGQHTDAREADPRRRRRGDDGPHSIEKRAARGRDVLE